MGEATTALGAGGREQKQRPAFPHAADLSSIRPERLNRLAIPIIAVRHIFSFMKQLLPTRSAFLLRARRVLCHAILTDEKASCLMVDGHWRCWPDILATSLACFEYKRRLSRSHPLSGGISLPLVLPAVPQRRRAPLPAAVSRTGARDGRPCRAGEPSAPPCLSWQGERLPGPRSRARKCAIIEPSTGQGERRPRLVALS